MRVERCPAVEPGHGWGRNQPAGGPLDLVSIRSEAITAMMSNDSTARPSLETVIGILRRMLGEEEPTSRRTRPRRGGVVLRSTRFR